MPGLIADTHVHIYSLFDLEELLINAKENLTQLKKSASDELAIFLTERADCDFFPKLEGFKSPEFEIQNIAGVCLVNFSDDCRLWVIPGYQVNTAERIELLALASKTRVSDKLTFEQSVVQISSNAGIAVACWAFGKWFGARRRILQKYLATPNSSKILLADSALRFYPEPILLHANQNLLAGTDPLPLRADERRVGSYAIYFSNGFDPAAPLESARHLLRNSMPQIVGQKLSFVAAFSRVIRMNFGSGKRYQEAGNTAI